MPLKMYMSSKPPVGRQIKKQILGIFKTGLKERTWKQDGSG
jgi:hypothetical protein